MVKGKQRVKSASGKFVKAPADKLPMVEELNIRTQQVARGFYPDRTVEPDTSLDDEERIAAARKLAALYEKLGEPVPAALLILI